MNLTPMKYLLYIENLTTVFRNYFLLKRRTRIIVLLWVIIETFNNSLTAVAIFTYNDTFLRATLYFLMSSGFSIYILIISLYYSKRFYRLVFNFDAFNKMFDDAVYNRKMLKAQKLLTFRAMVFCGFVLAVFASSRVLSSTGGVMRWVVDIIYLYCISMSDIRYIFQYFVLHCILFVFSEQLKVITRSIEGELSSIMDSRRSMEHANLSRVVNTYDKLYKWVKAYENINEASNLCKSIFSTQLTIMLLTVTAYYIILMYTIIISLTAKGTDMLSLQLTNVFAMAAFLSALLLISRAGQQIQNNYMELRQKLCELCLHTLEHEKYYKLTKDLLRCVRTRPISLLLFGTLYVDMSLLPSIVAFFTSNTVIALQFNNVL